MKALKRLLEQLGEAPSVETKKFVMSRITEERTRLVKITDSLEDCIDASALLAADLVRSQSYEKEFQATCFIEREKEKEQERKVLQASLPKFSWQKWEKLEGSYELSYWTFRDQVEKCEQLYPEPSQASQMWSQIALFTPKEFQAKVESFKMMTDGTKAMIKHFDVTLGKPSIQIPLLENTLADVPIAYKRENLPEVCKKIMDLLARLQFVHAKVDPSVASPIPMGEYVL